MNIIYEDRELEGERLELADKEGLYFLGSNLLLRNCTVVLRVPTSRLLICPSRFIDCTLQVKQELKNLDWSRAFLKGCRFTGRLTGCDFGHRLPHLPGRENGGIKDCDFTEACLSYCRFHGCDMRALRLPRWPCFTILNPLERSSELSRLEWPGGLVPVTIEDPINEPPSTVALTLYAPAFVQGSGITPEALLAFIEQLDGVIY